MKKFIQLLLVAGLALVFGTLTAFAQSGTSVKGNIPFDFAVGNTTLQKGSYKITVSKDDLGGAVVSITDRNGNRIETVVGTINGSKTAENTELVFERDGENRILTGIVTSNYAVEIPTSKNRPVTEASSPGTRGADKKNGANN